jgi:glycosyltransferase involved in cell wall biosynthesis
MRTSVSNSGGKRLKGDLASSRPGQPLVTIITAVFNGDSHLASCLESAINQDYPNVEHIVVDGGSTDRTVDILRQFDGQIALWRSEPDRGVPDAWNKALQEARGDWICFLGADDELLSHSVSAYIALAEQNPQAEFLSAKVTFVHPSGYERTVGKPWTWKRFSRTMCTPHPGSMHRRDLFERLGNYDTSFPIVQDYELLLRAGPSLRTAFMPVVTVRMRVGGQSCSRITLDEMARAKATTGRRDRFRTTIELCIDRFKFMLRPLHYALGGLLMEFMRHDESVPR